MTIVVGTNTYVSVANADTYFSLALHAATWTAAVTATKESALVTAARMLDRQNWQGAKTVEAQAMMWPRTGLVDKYGIAVPSATVPQAVIDAQCELALALMNDSSIQESINTAPKVTSVAAGSVSVTMKNTPERYVTRLPTIIHELVGQYLGGKATTSMKAYGTDVTSSFGGDNDYSIV